VDDLDKRRQPRMLLDSILLPFLGCREDDHASFQYLPLELSTQGYRIAVPRWVVSRERIQVNDLITLNSPFRFQGRTFYQGRVTWTSWDEALVSQVSGLSLEQEMPPTYPVYFTVQDSGITLNQEQFATVDSCILGLFKDLFLLKRGVSIYFKHLVPYFSRITGYSTKEYPHLKDLLLSDIQIKITEHIDKLTKIFTEMQSFHNLYQYIANSLDLEHLRGLVESEISLDLLLITFESESIRQYLTAIKELENKLYANYNNLAMIYASSFLIYKTNSVNPG
jgi:hypothetical protein